jgi:hypothetical protein
MEQTQNARWDPSAPIDQLTTNNFSADIVTLDAYAGSGSALSATRSVQITPLPNSSNPDYKIIKAQVVWSYKGRGPFTNGLFSVRSPDQ